MPGLRLHLLTLTTGKPGPDLRVRFDQLRAGVRALMQSRRLNGVSVIEWTRRPTGFHVHAHVVFLDANPWPPPHGWRTLRGEVVRHGLGPVAHLKLARKTGGLFAARYVLKYVSKALASPERARELKGRRLWTGHGSVSSSKGSPAAAYRLDSYLRRMAQKASDDGIRAT